MASNIIYLEAQERNIIAGLRNGDEQIFKSVFEIYYPRLCNYANSILNDMNEAEEMVQNAFLAVWEKHESLNIHTSLKSYLYRAVYNSSLNKVKNLKVRREHGESYCYHKDSTVDDTAHRIMGSEMEALMNSTIEQLPPQCRTVFKLSRFENLTYAEIAQQLGVSVKTIENHMVKALRELRRKFKDYLPLIIWIIMLKN